MTKLPMIKTPQKSICVCFGKENNWENSLEYFLNVAKRATRNSEDNLFVLTIVLRELLKLKKNEQVNFDFGTKKEWQLKRIK